MVVTTMMIFLTSQFCPFPGKAGVRSRADLAFVAALAMWAKVFRLSHFFRSENTQVSISSSVLNWFQDVFKATHGYQCFYLKCLKWLAKRSYHKHAFNLGLFDRTQSYNQNLVKISFKFHDSSLLSLAT
jgi:hypothetical protein